MVGVRTPSGPTRSGQLWSGSVTATARPWPHDPTVAYLLIAGGHTDTTHLPRPDIVHEWLHTLSMWGYQAVRTGAVGPDIAADLGAAGFTTCQDLLLMSRDLTHGPVRPAPDPDIAVLRSWPRPSRTAIHALLGVDAASFGPIWTLDPDSFADARRATHRSRILVARENGAPVGFVLAGATGPGGYIQRLAVLPDHRRRHVASRLLEHAHGWLRDRGCTTAVVNTEVANHAAIALYQRFGYARLPYGLRVLERPLTPTSPGATA